MATIEELQAQRQELAKQVEAAKAEASGLLAQVSELRKQKLAALSENNTRLAEQLDQQITQVSYQNERIYTDTIPKLEQQSYDLAVKINDLKDAPPTPATQADKTKEGATAPVTSDKAENESEDDRGEEQTNPTPSNTKGNQGSPTERQRNPLGDYSSSTYSIALYMVTPEAYTQYGDTGKWDLKSLVLIVQSGGINNKGETPRSTAFGGLDLHIDNLEITSLINPKETGVATTSYEFKFQIFEPYGISFTTNLARAAVEMQRRSNMRQKITQPLNALMTNYLIVIKFYGYDSSGNLVSGATNSGINSGSTGGAAFERSFPINIVNMKSKFDNKNSTYDITAAMTNQQIAFGKKRGLVPDATTLSSDTVKGALDLLAASMNHKQVLAVKKGEQEFPDEYEFIFTANSNIGGSLIADKNHFVVGNSPMPEVLNSMNINVRLSDSGKAEQISKQKRNIQIAALTPMMSVIDQVITQSTYLSDVLKVVDKEILDKIDPKDKAFVANPNPKQLEWYHVTPRIAVKQFDNLRNEFAYKMIYIIQPKLVPYVRSTAVTNTSSYEGAYKVYDYWYTGRNSEILSYDQTFNLLYYLEGAAASEAPSANKSDPAPNKASAASNASPVGRTPGTNEVVNTVRTSLYSPGDNLNANLKILGDPDFLMTSEAGTVREGEQGRQWYGDDLTVNPGASQVFIEVGFQQVTDYDTSTGILKPNNDIFFWDYPEDVKKKSNNRMIYMVTSLKSRFSKGLFTQELKTILPPFSGDNKSTENDERADTKAETKAATSVTNTGGRGSWGFSTPDPRLTLPTETPKNAYPMTVNENFNSVATSPEDDNTKPVVFRTPIPAMNRELPNTNNSIIRITPNK